MLIVNNERFLRFLDIETNQSDSELKGTYIEIISKCGGKIKGDTAEVKNEHVFFEEVIDNLWQSSCPRCTVERAFYNFVCNESTDRTTQNTEIFLDKYGVTSACYNSCKACWINSNKNNMLGELLTNVIKAVNKDVNKGMVFKKKGE